MRQKENIILNQNINNNILNNHCNVDKFKKLTLIFKIKKF